MNGAGRQDGPLRPDYGPGWADLRCDDPQPELIPVYHEAWQCGRCGRIYRPET